MVPVHKVPAAQVAAAQVIIVITQVLQVLLILEVAAAQVAGLIRMVAREQPVVLV
jgi:hypothetical protein